MTRPTDPPAKRAPSVLVRHQLALSLQFGALAQAPLHRSALLRHQVARWLRQALQSDADLVLCAPVIAREAAEQGKTLRAHYAHLLVHGALHAQGWEHDSSPRAARAMEAREIAILAGLGFASPY